MIFLISTPQLYFLGKKTPFNYLINSITAEYKNKKNIEIYRSISQLKNLAIAKQDNPPGADFILEQLRKFTHTIRPIFNKTISIWQLGNKEEACKYFGQAIGTKEGLEMANIFLKLDTLNPVELKDQLILFQENVKQARKTQKLIENERNSNIIYAVVTATTVMVLWNFIVVVYFIDTLKMLKNFTI